MTRSSIALFAALITGCSVEGPSRRPDGPVSELARHWAVSPCSSPPSQEAAMRMAAEAILTHEAVDVSDYALVVACEVPPEPGMDRLIFVVAAFDSPFRNAAQLGVYGTVAETGKERRVVGSARLFAKTRLGEGIPFEIADEMFTLAGPEIQQGDCQLNRDGQIIEEISSTPPGSAAQATHVLKCVRSIEKDDKMVTTSILFQWDGKTLTKLESMKTEVHM